MLSVSLCSNAVNDVDIATRYLIAKHSGWKMVHGSSFPQLAPQKCTSRELNPRETCEKMNGLKNREPPAWLLFHCFIDIMIKKEGERERE